MKKLMLSALFAVGLVAAVEAAPEDVVTQADLQAIFERLSRLEAENKAQADRIAELESQNRELVSAQASDKRDLLAAQKTYKDQLAEVKADYSRAIKVVKADYSRDLALIKEESRRELAALQASNKRDLAETEVAFKNEIAAATALNVDETTEKSKSGRIFTTETGKKYYLADATARIFEPLSESGLQITPYGYLVFEAIHNTKGTESDYYSDMVRPKGSSGRGHQTSFSMQDSILGLQFDTPESYNGWKFTGRAEFDLAGDNSNDYAFHWRHLYVDAQHESGWSILFGQTWHLWKMVSPSEIDGAWMEQTGHPYRRSPQIRVTKKWNIDDESSLELRAGLVKNGNGMGRDRDDDGNLDNTASAWALAEAALIYDRKAAWEDGDRRWLVGLAGMYGREKAHNLNGSNEEFDSKMVMLAASVPFLDKFTLTGQMFVGENLDGIQAGCYQGTYFRGNGHYGEVATRGGFVDLTYDLNDTWSFAVGYGIDDPNDNHAAKSGMGVCLNDRAYVDVFYRITPNFKLAFEYAHLRTKYNEGTTAGERGTASADRFQFAAFYDF